MKYAVNVCNRESLAQGKIERIYNILKICVYYNCIPNLRYLNHFKLMNTAETRCARRYSGYFLGKHPKNCG